MDNLGNTPTCVGKTLCRQGTPWRGWKHPHVRGEDPCLKGSAQSPGETPPRAWGRRYVPRPEKVGGGNTPTCVGKTSHPYTIRSRLKKHPHVRGEDTSPRLMCPGAPETPPRAWGRHGFLLLQSFFIGNTPTCVGKTLSSLSAVGVPKKHPHVRGEDST